MNLPNDPPEYVVYHVLRPYIGQALVLDGIRKTNQFALFQLLLVACACNQAKEGPRK